MQNGSPSSSADASEAMEIARLTEELNSGEATISALESELKSNRKETLQLRSKTASLSLSLEGLKEELQLLLQNEAEIHNNNAPVNNDEIEHGGDNTDHVSVSSDPAHDHATFYALTGQLEATKLSVEKAVHERDDLLRKMSAEGTIQVAFEDEFTSSSRRNVSALSFHMKLMKTEEATPARGMERMEGMDIIQKLNALSLSAERSTFRDDHARIWRDSTLPNVALLTWKPGAQGKVPDGVSCGVVSERLFEGITAYTSTNEKGETDQHWYLSSCSQTAPVIEEEFQAVKNVYSALVLEDASKRRKQTHNTNMRIIAPKQALERVLQLITSAANHSTPCIISPTGSALASTTPTSTPTSTPRASDNNNDGKKKNEKRWLKTPLSPTASKRPASIKSPRIKPSRRGEPHLSEVSHVLSKEHVKFLVNECIPVRFQECDLQLKYSTNNNGMSVHTLYEKVRNVSPTILAVRDNHGRVFGCYAASAWKTTTPRYYGTGECFVFSCKPRLAVYKWNRRHRNNFFQFSANNNILAMGGGSEGTSHYALWVDEDLIRGTTANCSTFDSPPLTHKTATTNDESGTKVDFDIVVLEVWTVVPRSHHHIPAVS